METTEWQPASVYNMVVWWDHYNGSPASTLAVQIAQKQFTISPRANWSYGCQLSTLQKRSVIQLSAILWFTASAHYVCGVFSHFLSQLSAALSNRRRLYASCGRADPLPSPLHVWHFFHHCIEPLLTAFICRTPAVLNPQLKDPYDTMELRWRLDTSGYSSMRAHARAGAGLDHGASYIWVARCDPPPPRCRQEIAALRLSSTFCPTLD
jgi:hypothetical protein